MLWRPAQIIIAHPALFTAAEIELFEKYILENPQAREHDASEFFAKHPKFLFLGTGAEVRREILLVSKEGTTTRRVDFFRRRYGEIFWDIIELKGPDKPSFIGSNHGHPRPSSFLVQALNQAEDYRDMIITDEALRARLWRIGIAVCRPQMLVVVGRDDSELSPETVAVLHDRIRRGPIEATTYTEIYNFAKEHCACNSVLVLRPFSCPVDRIRSLSAISPDTIIADRNEASILSFGPTCADLTLDNWSDRASTLLKVAKESASPLLVLDMAHVQCLSSAVLGAAIRAAKTLSNRGGSLAFANMKAGIREVFKITRLDKIFVVAESVDDAISRMKVNP